MKGQVSIVGIAVSQVSFNVHALICPTISREITEDSRRRPDSSHSLLQHVVERYIVAGDSRSSRVGQAKFHLVRRQLRMDLQHERNNTGRNSGSHASSAHAKQANVLRMVGMLFSQFGRFALIRSVVVHERHNLRSRSQHVWFDEAICGWPRSRPTRQVVTGPVSRCAQTVDSAHGDDIRVIAGNGDGFRIGSAVASRGHNHDTGSPGLLDSSVQGIDEIRHGCICAHADV